MYKNRRALEGWPPHFVCFFQKRYRATGADVREDPIDIEAIDFYFEGRWRDALLKREDSRCFYCLRELRSNWVLDHVFPAVNDGTNSYRNVVACCHECNSAKQASSAEDFLRSLYCRGLLGLPEFEARKIALERLKSGN